MIPRNKRHGHPESVETKECLVGDDILMSILAQTNNFY